jgi:hypothetical protein
MNWKQYVLLIWNSGGKLALTAIAKRTDNKWDDLAVDSIDKVINQVLG